MSDGITIHCPNCGKLTALKKEYDELKVKLQNSNSEYYDSSLPVYTCLECGAKNVIESVYKRSSLNIGSGKVAK